MNGITGNPFPKREVWGREFDGNKHNYKKKQNKVPSSKDFKKNSRTVMKTFSSSTVKH